MFVVFEGIDGSGKTTLSNQVAETLRQEGLSVEHVREGGKFSSVVVQAMRELSRDQRNFALGPQAELLLFAARDAQLLEETTRPALERAEVVLADRYLYTAEALAHGGRGLPHEVIQPVLVAASGGLVPDLVILLDTDPQVARARRRIAKIITPDPRPSSRKGLAGVGLSYRVREGYRQIAARESERWITIDNTEADVDQLVRHLTRVVATAVRQGVPAARVLAQSERSRPQADVMRVATPSGALHVFLEWVDRRLEHEPGLAAYFLAGLAGPQVDERRWALSKRAPEVVAAGLWGLDDAVSWQLRRHLASCTPRLVARSLGGPFLGTSQAYALRRELVSEAPAEVAASLEGRDDETSWDLREELYQPAPDTVVASLKCLASDRAWALRARWLAQRGGLRSAVESYPGARAAGKAVAGLDDSAAWEWRKAALAEAPVAALASLSGLEGDRSWKWRQRYRDRAPKVIARTLDGMTGAEAWTLRQALTPHCKETLDSIYGLNGDEAWRLRATGADLWPSAVVKSLGPLASTSEGRELVARQLRRNPGDLLLLKHASAIALETPC